MKASGKMVPDVPSFDRRFGDGALRFAKIGKGALGGKASGLIAANRCIAAVESPAMEVAIPRMVVIATDHFDAFLQDNGLRESLVRCNDDEDVARLFLRAELPPGLVGDLRALTEQLHAPLAVRSSSLLEDALDEPFAGVYATKMIPNNAHDPDLRWRKLVEAVKFVWASTYFREATEYVRATGHDPGDEKMAVILQEVVGRLHRDRYYPDLSGVARSFNFYPSGHALPDEGVVNLALGLGKTIVDGGVSWTFSPAWPRARPPFSSPQETLDNTQVEFWAVHMGTPTYDPLRETEYLVRCGLDAAEDDGTLRWTASTYDATSDRIVMGTAAPGPRVLDFAPLLGLDEWGFPSLIRRLLEAAEALAGEKVEIEFAVTFPDRQGDSARFGFLQVRPLAVGHEVVDVGDAVMEGPDTLLASTRTLGNGIDETIYDIVYVRPEIFDPARSSEIAVEIERINQGLADAGRPYVLVGFGRWGSNDPWLGIPVNWSQISAARVIVESGLAHVRIDPSQGSHFFHNICSFRIPYFAIRQDLDRPVAWELLESLLVVEETRFVRHVRSPAPMSVLVDGRSGRGAILLRKPPVASGAPS